MSDQTPRVPDFWWSSRNGLLARKYPEDQYFRLTYGYTTGPMPDLPADAVKLGDVEGHVNAQRTAEERCTRVARELDDLRADIREVVQESWVRPRMTVVALDRIRAIVDREPVREEPRETEWGWRPDPVDEPRAVISASDEQAARERASKARGRAAVRREVGPWTVVES